MSSLDADDSDYEYSSVIDKQTTAKCKLLLRVSVPAGALGLLAADYYISVLYGVIVV